MLWDPKEVEHVAHLCEQSKQSSKGSKVIELYRGRRNTTEVGDVADARRESCGIRLQGRIL